MQIIPCDRTELSFWVHLNLHKSQSKPTCLSASCRFHRVSGTELEIDACDLTLQECNWSLWKGVFSHGTVCSSVATRPSFCMKCKKSPCQRCGAEAFDSVGFGIRKRHERHPWSTGADRAALAQFSQSSLTTPQGASPFRPRLDATSRLDQKFKPSDKLVESLLLFMNNKVIHSSSDQSDKLFKEKLRLRTNKAYPSSSLEHEIKGIRVTISWTIFWLKSL